MDAAPTLSAADPVAPTRLFRSAGAWLGTIAWFGLVAIAVSNLDRDEAGRAPGAVMRAVPPEAARARFAWDEPAGPWQAARIARSATERDAHADTGRAPTR